MATGASGSDVLIPLYARKQGRTICNRYTNASVCVSVPLGSAARAQRGKHP